MFVQWTRRLASGLIGIAKEQAHTMNTEELLRNLTQPDAMLMAKRELSVFILA